MTAYRMMPLQGDERFHRIYEGKRWAGRVYFDSIRGRWVGVIGEHKARGKFPIEAFAEVGARASGFKSAVDMHERRQARRRRPPSVAKIRYGAELRASLMHDVLRVRA
jgi:hypothetical protein